MKVAVTGATGFVGRHVADALAAEPDVELVLAGRRGAARGELPSRIEQVRIDHANPSPSDFDRLGRPDVLVHLAWDGLPNYRSLHHFETELPRQYRFLRGLIDSGLPALVVAGTCFEYGLQSGPLHEALPAEPTNPYGHAKDALRRQLFFLKSVQAFKLTWARLFYVYGEGQSPQSLYSQLAAACARGDTHFDMSPGDQLRDYLPVEQVASIISGLARTAPDTGIVNVCSGRPVAVRSLVERWLADRGARLELALGRHPYSPLEPMAFWGDRRRLDDALAQESRS